MPCGRVSAGCRKDPRNTVNVFVLSGGGNLGAIQVGMLQALSEAEIYPDAIVGTSVGAINGAWLAGRGPDADIGELADVWRGMRRADVFPTRLFGGLRGFLGQSDHLVPDSGIRRLLARELPFENLEDALVPLHVVATDIRSGKDHLLSQGNAADAVCASSAIPGVFPAVTIGGRTFVDGGVINNCPISHAMALGATTVWVLPCGYSCALDRPPTSALGNALQAINLLIQQRLHNDAETFANRALLHIAPTPCPVTVSPTDFSQASRLIETSHELTTAWIADPTAFVDDPLLPHGHHD